MERLHAIVKGSVQGVGFRYWARREARYLGLAGFARNLPDGDVEIVAEGERSSLTQFLASLRLGPSNADVDTVVSSFSAMTGEHTDFIIM